jgi:hypothetical protein
MNLRTTPAFVAQTETLFRALEQHGGLDDSHGRTTELGA